MRGRGREIPGPVTIKLRPAVLISASAVSTTSPARPRSTSRRASLIADDSMVVAISSSWDTIRVTVAPSLVMACVKV